MQKVFESTALPTVATWH